MVPGHCAGSSRRCSRKLALAAAALLLLSACGRPGVPAAGPDAAESAAGQEAEPEGEAADSAAAAGTDTATENDAVDAVSPYPGYVAPPWQGIDVQSGKTLKSTDLEGKVVYLNFFATWCPPCRAEMPDMQRLHEERSDQVAIVAIGVDPTESAEQLAAFAAQLDLTFPVVADAATYGRTYRVTAVPTSLFIDAEGVVRLRHPGILTYEQMQQVVNELAGPPAPGADAEADAEAGSDAGPGTGPDQDPDAEPDGEADPAPGGEAGGTDPTAGETEPGPGTPEPAGP